MGAKDGFLFIDFGQLRQRKNLKATAVGQDRPIPAHKLVQAPQILDHVFPRSQCKVVSIPQKNLSTGGSNLLNRQTLDGSECPHRHEGWQVNVASRRLQHSNSSTTTRILMNKPIANRSIFLHATPLVASVASRPGSTPNPSIKKPGPRKTGFSRVTLSLRTSHPYSPRSLSPSCSSFSRTSFRLVTPKFLHSSRSS